MMLSIAQLPFFNQLPLPKVDDKPKPSPPKTLDILSLNTQLLSSPFGSDQEARASRIGSSLSQFEIVGLQETFSNDSQPIVEKTKNTHEAHRQTEGAFLTDSSGLTTLSKNEILDTDFHEFSYSSGTDSYSRKGVIFTRIAVPGIGPVDVYNTHLQAEPDTASDIVNGLSFASRLVSPLMSIFSSPPLSTEEIREKQIDEIANFVKEHDQGNPTFFTGDFNLVEGTDNYTHLLQTLRVKDSFDELHPDSAGVTSPEDHTRYDYIFYRGGARQKIIPIFSEVTHNQPIDDMMISDHYGVHTRFEFVDK